MKVSVEYFHNIITNQAGKLLAYEGIMEDLQEKNVALEAKVKELTPDEDPKEKAKKDLLRSPKGKGNGPSVPART